MRSSKYRSESVTYRPEYIYIDAFKVVLELRKVRDFHVFRVLVLDSVLTENVLGKCKQCRCSLNSHHKLRVGRDEAAVGATLSALHLRGLHQLPLLRNLRLRPIFAHLFVCVREINIQC